MAGRRAGPQLAARLIAGLRSSPAFLSCLESTGSQASRQFSRVAVGKPEASLRVLKDLQFSPFGFRCFASLPPHTELAMPSLSPTMNQGNIAVWKKKEGDEIAAGDVLCEIETDKATMDWEAQEEGFLAKILLGDGSKDILVGTPVAIFVEERDSVAAFADYTAGSGGGEAAAAAETLAEPEAAEEASSEEAPAESESAGDYPPHIVMGLPALSPTMSQGNIAKWNKKEGDEVAAGESLAEVETDKATMDWEAQDEGFVAKLLVAEGAQGIAAGAPVLIMVEDKDSVAAFANYTTPSEKPATKKAPAAPKAAAPKAAEPTKAAPKAAAPKKASSGGRVAASPLARKLASEAGVDVAQASGSGPGGRITAADVQALISSGGGKAPAAGGAPSQVGAGEFYTDMPNSQIRKITARRLLESKQTIPHYYLSIDCRVDKLHALRAQLNAALADKGTKLSVNDFIVKASALALRKVPEVNASWFPEFIRQYHTVDICVAVQTPTGLMTPILTDADARGLAEISGAVKTLAGKAKEGKLSPEEFMGGTFTISNLGMFGVTNFSAIINPPQSCILAVGASNKRVVLAPGGGFEEADVMSVTLSCDHRVVDGALGATWLQAFRGYVEDPLTMLL